MWPAIYPSTAAVATDLHTHLSGICNKINGINLKASHSGGGAVAVATVNAAAGAKVGRCPYVTMESNHDDIYIEIVQICLSTQLPLIYVWDWKHRSILVLYFILHDMTQGDHGLATYLRATRHNIIIIFT